MTAVLLTKLTGGEEGDGDGEGGRDVGREKELLTRSVTQWTSLVRSISTPMMGDGYANICFEYMLSFVYFRRHYVLRFHNRHSLSLRGVIGFKFWGCRGCKRRGCGTVVPSQVSLPYKEV